jgi:hypothetical protein
VLKGTLADQVTQSMHLIEEATGLDCTFCHVEGALEKDDEAPKATARKMMQNSFRLRRAEAERFPGR